MLRGHIGTLALRGRFTYTFARSRGGGGHDTACVVTTTAAAAARRARPVYSYVRGRDERYLEIRLGSMEREETIGNCRVWGWVRLECRKVVSGIATPVSLNESANVAVEASFT